MSYVWLLCLLLPDGWFCLGEDEPNLKRLRFTTESQCTEILNSKDTEMYLKPFSDKIECHKILLKEEK